MFQAPCRAAAAALASCAVCSSVAAALPPWLTRVATTDTPAPGVANSNFSSFHLAPVATGNFIYMGGRWGSGSGIVRYNGFDLDNLVSNVTLTPEGVEPFSGFTSLSASGVRFAFGATFGDANGAFMTTGSGLVTIADTDPISDSGVKIFEAIGAPSISGDIASIWGFTPESSVSDAGIFQTSSRATEQNRIVRLGQASPGGGQVFSSFGPNPVNGGGVTLFWGQTSSRQGLYVSTGGGFVSTFVDSASTIAGQTGGVTDIRQNFSYDGTFAAFIGKGTFGAPAIFHGTTGNVSRIVSLFDAIPEGFGTFFDFRDVAVSGDRVVFTATGAQSQQGLYAWIGGEIIRLADRTTELEDGKSIASFRIGREAIFADGVAFVAEFTDGSSGVYRFDLAVFPAPGAVLALPVAMLAASRRRRV